MSVRMSRPETETDKSRLVSMIGQDILTDI
jgi:hypothetical protein